MARTRITDRSVSFLRTDCPDDGNRSAPAATLGGHENTRRENFAVTIGEGAAAFPLTEPTLLRTSLASRGGQTGRFLGGGVDFEGKG